MPLIVPCHDPVTLTSVIHVALNVLPSARIALEHQIDMGGMSSSILAADNEGTGTEFLWGFLMGLLLGVFMLLMVIRFLG